MSEEVKSAPAKKSKGRLVLMLAVVLVVLGGGGAGAFWWMSRGADAAQGAKTDGTKAGAVHDDSHAAPVALPTFTVNLADQDASRYLRVTLALIVPSPEDADAIAGAGHDGGSVKLMKARSAILELLSTQTSGALATAEGKETLKKAIAERASKAFGTVKVNDVLFSEFVVQF